MSISILKKTTIEFAKLVDVKNIEEIEEYIHTIEEDSKNEDYNFKTELITSIVSLIIFNTLEKKYIGELANRLPSINKIKLFLFEKKWKNTLRIVLLEYYDEDTVEKYLNTFFEILKTNTYKKYQFENNIYFFNPINIIYNILKFFAVALFFSFIYGFGVVIKHSTFNVSIEDDKILNEIDRNFESLNIFDIHNLYGSNNILIITIIITFITYQIIKKILESIRVSKLRHNTKKIEIKDITFLQKVINTGEQNILFLKNFKQTPFVGKGKNNTPFVVIPNKMLLKKHTAKFKFIINHEFYHIINKDYLRNKTILKIFIWAFYLYFFFSICINYILEKFDYKNVDTYLGLFFYSILIYCSIYLNKLNEFRADFYAYKKTKDINYSSYFNKQIRFFKKIYYPTNKERVNYISNFPKKELSFPTVFYLSLTGLCTIFFSSGLFPFFNIINLIIITSLLYLFIHTTKIQTFERLTTKQLITSYFYWLISIITLVFYFWSSTLLENKEYFTFLETLTELCRYLFPFIISVPFLILITKLKKINFTLFIISIVVSFFINDIIFQESSLIYIYDVNQNDYPGILNVFFISVLTFIVNLIYSISYKNETPVGNTV